MSLLLCVWNVFVVVCVGRLSSCLCCCLWEVSGFRPLLLSVGSLWIQVFVVVCGKSLDSGLCCYVWDVFGIMSVVVSAGRLRFLSLLLLGILVFVTSRDSCLCYFSGFLSLLLLGIPVFVTSRDSCLCCCVCVTSLER